MTRCLIVQHDEPDPPALIGDYLREVGVELDLRRLHAGDRLPSPAELDASDALVVLGGEMDVDQEAQHPWLANERELLAEAVGRELPTLGVCLGAQQLALAAGGHVYLRAVMDRGWEPIEFLARDELVAGLHPRPYVLSWRRYACALPDDATLLADTDGEPQIYRVGRRAWGVLFHPEVDRKLVLGWLRRDAAEIEQTYQGGAKAFRKKTKRELLRSVMLCGQLMANFVAVVRES